MAVTSARPPQLKTAPTFASLVVPPGTDVGAARKLLEQAQDGCLIASPCRWPLPSIHRAPPSHWAISHSSSASTWKSAHSVRWDCAFRARTSGSQRTYAARRAQLPDDGGAIARSSGKMSAAMPHWHGSLREWNRQQRKAAIGVVRIDVGLALFSANQSSTLKLYFTLNWYRTSSPVVPSLSVRLPQSNSTPIMTLATGYISRFAEAYCPL